MFDIDTIKGERIHMIGIGGSSMSGLAEMLLMLGYKVSGSDKSEGHYTQKLVKLGVDVRIGHYPNMLNGASLLVYSAAISEDDPEMKEAKRLHIPRLERAELLGQIMRKYKRRICISGTHGKTTTTSMLAKAAVGLGLEPGVHIGGQLKAIGGSTLCGNGDIFIAEACEFNRSFLNMPSDISVILNIEAEHLDCYGTFDKLKEAFHSFANMLPENGLLIYYEADAEASDISKNIRARSENVGIKAGTWHAENVSYDVQGHPSFDVVYKGESLGRLSLSVGGDFNIIHALVSLAVLNELGIKSLDKAMTELSDFLGADRRNEKTGVINGINMYHDYGHNAKEMQGAISVAKKSGKRLIAVMQPHTYSRFFDFFDDLAECTREADITLVTDICAAREIKGEIAKLRAVDESLLDSARLVEKMRENGINAYLTRSFDDCEHWILENCREGDSVLTMGCGDINDLNIQMQKHHDGILEDR